MVKSKKRKKGEKRKRFHLSKDRRKQLIALFLVLIMVGSVLVLVFSY